MTDTQPFNPDTYEDSFDLRKWAGKILINWYWFAISVAIFGAGAYFFTRYSVPHFQVSASLLLQDQKGSGSTQLFQGMDLFGQQRNISNEIAMLKSWTLARRALVEINFETTYMVIGRWTERELYENIPFKVTTGPNPQNMAGMKIGITVLSDTEYQLEIGGGYNINVKQQFNQPYQHGDLNFIISRNPNFNQKALPAFLRTNKYYFVVNNIDALAYSYQSRLGVGLDDKASSLLTLTMQGPDGFQAVDYLNTLMKEYIKSSLELKNLTAANTVKFIDDQLLIIVDTLRRAEQSLQDFRSHNQVINISAEGSVIMSDVNRLAEEKALSDMQMQYYEYLLTYLKSEGNFTNIMAPSTMGITDPMFSSLMNNLIQLSTQRATLEYSAKENNQALIKVNLLIKNNRETLIEILRNIMQNAKLKETDLNHRISQVDSRIQELPITERQLANITRKFELQNSIYTFLLQRRAEAGITQASNVPDQRVIDEARWDAVYRISPKNHKNYIMGLLLGLVFPLVIIFLKEILNFTVQEKGDVEKVTDVPILGTVGHNRHEDLLPVINYSRSSVAESFRAIRTNLQFSLYDDGRKVVMITSSTSGEGKSFMAMNLAGIFSVTGKKVVVVALDLRKPTAHKYFDITNNQGVSTYLIGKSSIDQILIPTDIPNLSVVPSGPVPPNPVELLELPRFAQLIAELRDAFDIIILDTPPVALVTDAMLVSKYADTTLYVVRQRFTQKTSLSFLKDIQKREHMKKLTIVINDVIVPRYYGYKYGYGYGYGYGKKYGSGYYSEEK